jgi:hypothetical protein
MFFPVTGASNACILNYSDITHKRAKINSWVEKSPLKYNGLWFSKVQPYLTRSYSFIFHFSYWVFLGITWLLTYWKTHKGYIRSMLQNINGCGWHTLDHCLWILCTYWLPLVTLWVLCVLLCVNWILKIK